MKKYFLLIPVLFITLLWMSCGTIAPSTSVSRTTHTTRRSATADTRDINEGSIAHLPLLVDLDVEDRLVLGSFSGNNISEEYAKNMAVANALRTAGADVLVQPFYDITQEDATISVNVKGHPAKYRNFRQPLTTGEKTATTEQRYVKPKKTEEKEKVIKKEIKPEEIKTDYTVNAETENIQATNAEKEEENTQIKVEDKTVVANDDVNDKKLKSPFYVISCAAVVSEFTAKSNIRELNGMGIIADYLYIPDYDPYGKTLYRVYVGPYKTKAQADNVLPKIKVQIPKAYVVAM